MEDDIELDGQPRAAGDDGVPAGAPETARARAVQWLDIAQLIRTATEVNRATSFAMYADRREQMANRPREFYEFPGSGVEPASGDFWLDYVSDTGDGFDATFATARCVSGGATVAQSRTWLGRMGPEVDFGNRPQRADLLVLGGDEVYPVASPSQYEVRLKSVFRRAAWLDGVDTRPPVLALPGNHDWYDGLAAFRRVFCQSGLRREPSAGRTPVPEVRDDVGGWGALQSRSYFAVKLTPKWWLWAVDSQLDAPIDTAQMEYFKQAADYLVRDGAKLILCTATPCWQLEAEGSKTYWAPDDSPLFTLLWFIDRTLGSTHRQLLRLVLTGDQHYYARHTPVGGAPVAPELITAGGGGAYLSSTHHLKPVLKFDLTPWTRTRNPADTSPGDSVSLRYRLDKRYPSGLQSRVLGAVKLPAALLGNGAKLPALLALMNLLLFPVLPTEPPAWNAIVPWLLHGHGLFTAWLGVAGLIALLYAYQGAGQRTKRKWRRRLFTVPLWVMQLAVQGFVTYVVRMQYLAFDDRRTWWAEAAFTAGTFVVLAVLSMAAFLTYLWVADVVLGCHTLEAFSGLRISGFKNHLRIRLTDDEAHIWVVGFDRAPWARWRKNLRGIKPKAYVVSEFSVPWGPPPPSLTISSDRTAGL
ncbi:MAG: hypothetical protein ACR2G2_08400 [Pseudonocardia sp.]